MPVPEMFSGGDEVERRYRAALAKLPLTDQELIDLRLEMQASYDELAERFGGQPRQLRRYLHQAYGRLASEMAGQPIRLHDRPFRRTSRALIVLRVLGHAFLRWPWRDRGPD